MFNVHDHLKHLTIPELQSISNSDRLDYSLCLLNLEYDLNIGNCIRTAHIMGCAKVFVFGKRRYDSRSTVGAHNYTNVIRIEVDDIEDRDCVAETFNNMVVDYLLYPIFIEKTKTSLPISYIKSTANYNPAEQQCLVIGNEQKGIPEYIIDDNQCYHIEQRGVIRSLNAASAAAIAMYELTRNL